MSRCAQPVTLRGDAVSLRRIAQRYRGRIAVTWSLLLIESFMELLFPLAIGFAVDALMDQHVTGLMMLGALSIGVLIIGAGRRFYDTRAYAVIYRELATTLVQHEHAHSTKTTKISARVGLLYEIVNFLEDLLPMLIQGLITLIGVITVIAWLDYRIMLSCFVATVLVAGIYALSEQRIFSYNKMQNNELEQQVDVLLKRDQRHVARHFQRLMKWNIKLSDLETANYSAVWLVMASLLLVAIVFIVDNVSISYGQKITSIMYVFEYIEVVMDFPIFYQQVIRLREITTRLSKSALLTTQPD
ncbi:MAG: ABC transporter six-transmembrane domain-containing protein [Gammaproteobacteria bacterium]|nr:ABC transporter six-transmembrane domain-containing protein [Gammaproteobacteria bacterium]